MNTCEETPMNFDVVCKIKVKPPQSGKTKDAIIDPMLESICNERLPIIIIPPRLQLQEQLENRTHNNKT